MTIRTNPEYWDCECEDKFIHNKKAFGLFCSECKSHEEEMPDSRVNEIKHLYHPEDGWL